MKILFLGTGAADWPRKKEAGMTEFRRLSSALIDDVLLIDPGPQVREALEELGRSPDRIKYIINTHKHSDHYSEETVKWLESFGAELIDVAAGEEMTIGRYTVWAYSGNHSTCDGTVHFIISDGESTVFYGLDGAWLMYDEVQGIMAHRPTLAVLDATIGFIDGDYRIFEHNNLNMVLEMKKTLSPYVGQFAISHMARTLHTAHEELAESMREHGVIAAYDGLELSVD